MGNKKRMAEEIYPGQFCCGLTASPRHFNITLAVLALLFPPAALCCKVST